MQFIIIPDDDLIRRETCTSWWFLLYYFNYNIIGGPGSPVGIATDYGLDGPGSNTRGDKIFRLSRPTLGPTQPPV